jgi:hypothetical protein
MVHVGRALIHDHVTRRVPVVLSRHSRVDLDNRLCPDLGPRLSNRNVVKIIASS